MALLGLRLVDRATVDSGPTQTHCVPSPAHTHTLVSVATNQTPSFAALIKDNYGKPIGKK